MNDSYFKYWGKAKRNPDDDGEEYHLLVYHSLDVAAVGKELLQQHPYLLEKFSALMELSREETTQWIVFLLGIHDLGKFSESFQQLRSDLRKHFFPDQKTMINHYDIRHDSLGLILWQCRRNGLDKHFLKAGLDHQTNSDSRFLIKRVFPVWLAPVFGHHGYPPHAEKKKKADSYFRESDQQSAKEFIHDWFKLIQPQYKAINLQNKNKDWLKKQKELSWLLAGFSVLCDWLGSNQDIFKYKAKEIPLESYWNDIAKSRAKKAIDEVRLLPSIIKPKGTLRTLFDYIKIPTPLQKTCAELSIRPEPQLFILEDVTGAGKTEAALILAYRLMEKQQAQGFYIGLPTMATANAMLERMATVYRNFYEDDQQPNVVLSHSARYLSELFQSAFLNTKQQEKTVYQKNDETITVQCSRWLADHRKKALLADIGIGTIDQALLGILPARHQSLRLLGLANKILILDEIHAYDAYTSTLLKTLLGFHASMGGSVILLSATLSMEQRQSFCDAYRKGLHAEPVKFSQMSYPLLTQVSKIDHEEIPVETRKSVERQVDIEFIYNEELAIKKIRDAVENGQCACWIRNTVPDARNALEQLESESWMPKDQLHLFHSRYALGDRIAIESAMLKKFGKKSTQKDRAGHVLIATQVIEQSLDLDFDVMITDLAPIDLLIQRAGRLQRHIRDIKGNCQDNLESDQRNKPILTILSPEDTDQPEKDWYKNLLPKANFVYSDTSILWLTSRILQRKKGWKMPDDARELIEFVYGDKGEVLSAEMKDTRIEAEGENMGDRGLASFNALRPELGYVRDYRVETPWDEEAHFPTRLGEDTHSIYLAKWDGTQLLPWINEKPFAWDMSSLSINKTLLATLADADHADIAKAIEQLGSNVTVFDEFSLIVPLQFVDGVWMAFGFDDKSTLMQINYCVNQGLIIIKEGQKAPP